MAIYGFTPVVETCLHYNILMPIHQALAQRTVNMERPAPSCARFDGPALASGIKKGLPRPARTQFAAYRFVSPFCSNVALRIRLLWITEIIAMDSKG